MNIGLKNKLTPLFVSVVLIVSCIISTEIILDETLLPRLLTTNVFVILMLGYLLIKKSRYKLSIDAISLFYLLFTFYACLSIYWSTNWSVSIFEVSKIILFFILFLLINNALTVYDKSFLNLLLKSIQILFFISCYYLIQQIIDLDDFSYISIYKLSGISGHKNLYSSFIFLISIFSIYSLFQFKNYWRYVILISIIIQISLVVLIRARTVWLAYLVFILIFTILHFIYHFKISYKWINFIIIFSIIIFFIAIFPIAIDFYIDRNIISNNIEKLTDLGTLSERILVWDKTYELIFDNFFFGVGPANWKICLPKYALPEIFKVQDLNVIFQRPHNEFLRLFAEYGIIGFFLIIFFISTIISNLYKVNQQKKEVKINILISGIIAFFTIAFFSFPLERVEHNILFANLLGISTYTIYNDGNNSIKKVFNFSILFTLILFFISIFLFFIFFLNLKSDYYYKKMIVERLKGNNFKVISLCNSAITPITTIDNVSIPFYWYRGNANANIGNYKEAFKDFKIAYEQNPFNQHVLNDLGSAYYKLGKIDSAIIFYKKAININPRFDDPKLNLTAIYIKEGNFSEAKKWNESLFHDSNRRSYYRSIINDNLK